MGRRPHWTHEELASYTPPRPALSVPITGWRIDERGNPGEQVTIPAGAQLINWDAPDCLKLLATYGRDRCVADVVMPDNSIVCLFFKLSEAARSLPPEAAAERWCVPCARYHVPAASGCKAETA